MKKPTLFILIAVVLGGGFIIYSLTWLCQFASPPDQFRYELMLKGWQEGLECMQFSPDAKRLVTGGHNSVSIWHLDGTKQTISIPGLEGDITLLLFSPDGRVLAVANYDSIVQLMNTETWDQQEVLNQKYPVKSLVFRENPNELIVGTGVKPDDRNQVGEIALWSIRPHKQTQLIPCSGIIKALGVSPDGQVLACVDGGSTIALWEFPDGKKVFELQGHKAKVSCIAFSPDGSKVASGDQSGRIIVWDVALRKMQAICGGHSGWVHALAFFPDGKILASGSSDKTVRLWDVESGRELGRLRGDPPLYVYCIAVSPDGEHLSLGTRHGPFSVWKVVRAAFSP